MWPLGVKTVREKVSVSYLLPHHADGLKRAEHVQRFLDFLEIGIAYEQRLKCFGTDQSRRSLKKKPRPYRPGLLLGSAVYFAAALVFAIEAERWRTCASFSSNCGLKLPFSTSALIAVRTSTNCALGTTTFVSSPTSLSGLLA